MGKMGAGKSLGATALAVALADGTGRPLYANYHIRHPQAHYIASTRELFAVESGILVLDEAHLFLDSRQWKDRGVIKLTHWATKIRKKNLICFLISQHIRQVDVRLRNLLDVLIVAERLDQLNFKFTFIDYQYRKLGRSIFLHGDKQYFELYDTFETLKPLTAGE